jgi:arylformamidase
MDTRLPIDISRPIVDGMATWPGDPPLRLERVARIADGEGFDVSRLSTSVHLGTHVDAPAHAVAGGAGVEHIALTTLIGPAVVVDLAGAARLDATALAAAVPPGATRVLLRTRNSLAAQEEGRIAAEPEGTEEPASAAARKPDLRREDQGFRTDFAAVEADAAAWLVAHGVLLVGIDGPSIAPWQDLETPHQILLGAGVVIVEGLCLSHVEPGRYDLICLPLPLVGSDGAPARAVLLPLG